MLQFFNNKYVVFLRYMIAAYLLSLGICEVIVFSFNSVNIVEMIKMDDYYKYMLGSPQDLGYKMVFDYQLYVYFQMFLFSILAYILCFSKKKMTINYKFISLILLFSLINMSFSFNEDNKNAIKYMVKTQGNIWLINCLTNVQCNQKYKIISQIKNENKLSDDDYRKVIFNIVIGNRDNNIQIYNKEYKKDINLESQVNLFVEKYGNESQILNFKKIK